MRRLLLWTWALAALCLPWAAQASTVAHHNAKPSAQRSHRPAVAPARAGQVPKTHRPAVAVKAGGTRAHKQGMRSSTSVAAKKKPSKRSVGGTHTSGRTATKAASGRHAVKSAGKKRTQRPLKVRKLKR